MALSKKCLAFLPLRAHINVSCEAVNMRLDRLGEAFGLNQAMSLRIGKPVDLRATPHWWTE
jgi:hypothetical protein